MAGVDGQITAVLTNENLLLERSDRKGMRIDFNAISKIIIESDYKGWIIVEAEQDPMAANPLEYALLSKKYLENIWSN